MSIKNLLDTIAEEIKSEWGKADDITVTRLMNAANCKRTKAENKINQLVQDGKIQYIGMLLDTTTGRPARHWRQIKKGSA